MSVEDETIQTRLEQLDKYKQTEGNYSVHLVALGSAGIGMAKALLRSDEAEELVDAGGELTVWAADIDNPELQEVEDAGEEFTKEFTPNQAQVSVRNIETPDREDLFETLRSYREYLKKEYPAYYWQPNYDPWIPADVDLDADPMRRGVAKAIYGHHYYNTEVLKEDLRALGDRVEETENPSHVYVAFGLGGGTGGGMVPDLSRHLSHVMLGRKTPVTGIGVLPCEGDPEEYRGANPYIALNDIDALIEEEANDGVVDVWGELYRNPFNNGFMMVSQEPAWQATNDLDEAHDIVDDAVAGLIARNGGRAGWNTMRVSSLLANIDNPSESWPPRSLPTHDVRWVNLLTPLADEDDIDAGTTDLTPGARTLHVEVQTTGSTDGLAEKVEAAFSAHTEHVAVSTVESSSDETEIFSFVPRLSKIELELFDRGQAAYKELSERDKVLDHSFLMELGVMLNEPSVRFEGVAGECIWGCACWVGVPMSRVDGSDLQAEIELPSTAGAPHEHAHEHDHAHDD